MVVRNRFLEEGTYFGSLQDSLKETISGSQAGQALTSSFIAMNRLCNKCSLDSAIHSQSDLASFRGCQEDFLKIYVRLWLSCIKHFTPKLVRMLETQRSLRWSSSQARNFSYNFQPSIHNWQTVPRCWFARYLHWIRNNRRRFSLRRPRRRYIIVRFEFTGASMRPYCESSGNSSLPGKRVTIQTSWSTYAQSTLRLKKWLKPSVCRSTITSWTASPCCRCTNCEVNTRSISATRIAFSCPPFGCPTSTLLRMCC